MAAKHLAVIATNCHCFNLLTKAMRDICLFPAVHTIDSDTEGRGMGPLN